jgi:hypothetical protein
MAIIPEEPNRRRIQHLVLTNLVLSKKSSTDAPLSQWLQALPPSSNSYLDTCLTSSALRVSPTSHLPSLRRLTLEYPSSPFEEAYEPAQDLDFGTKGPLLREMWVSLAFDNVVLPMLGLRLEQVVIRVADEELRREWQMIIEEIRRMDPGMEEHVRAVAVEGM